MSRAILLEAESFSELGDWVVDQEFMDQMGSPFVLAHGLGRPVADAVEKIQDGRLIGDWRLWVRTRDWVSPQGPGRFTIQFWRTTESGDRAMFLETKALGVGNGDWHWEDCGVFSFSDKSIEIRLHDLTGFEGRCDALMFVPINEGREPEPSWDLWSYRRKLLGLPVTPPTETFEFVVIGGGYAGMCAAVAAARKGVKTALVQDRPVFGGNASSEVRVGPIGRLGLPPFPRVSDLAYELAEVTRGKGETSGGLRPAPDDSRVAAWLSAEDNLTCFPNCRCCSVETSRQAIQAVIVRDILTAHETRLEGKFFCDATGDAWLARAAGAEVRVVAESQEETGEPLAPMKGAGFNGGYGATNYWLTCWTDEDVSFPSCPWALEINGESFAISDARSNVNGDYPYVAGWNWESGIHLDSVRNGEQIRDHNFRAAYGMWDYLKNKSPDKVKYAKAELSWLAYILGKRAAGRIIGDYVLCEQDLTQHRVYPDGVVMTTWFLDMHFPHPRNTRYFPGQEFRSFAYDDPNYEREKAPGAVGCYTTIKPYPIPFRCFYSKDVPNLFMAGKDISCTYVAMSSVRVENTTAQMGTMVGIAVSLCVKNDWTPRELGQNHLEALVGCLLRPWRQSRLSRMGQGRRTIKDEVRYHLRVLYHRFKKIIGRPYLEELTV